MKYLIILLALVLLSCKKNYTCECTIVNNWTEIHDSVPKLFNRTLIVTNNIKATKKNAQGLCSVGNASATTMSYEITGSNITTTVTTTDCKIK